MNCLALLSALAMGAGCAAWPVAAVGQTNEPLTLERALELAGVTAGAAPAARSARATGPYEEVAAAEALVLQAGLRPNPELALEVENLAGTGVFSGLRATEYTLSAGLPLELGGKRGARLGAARADLAVARLREQLAVGEIALAVRQRYVSAVAAQARLRLAEDVVARNLELSRIAAELVDAGREPPLRLLRANAELADARAELQGAQATALATRLALGVMWSEQVAAAPPEVFPVINPPYDALSAYAGLEPRLANAERLAAEADVGRQRSLGAPDPTVSAGVRRFAESGDQAFVVGLSVPLPVRNRNQGNVAAAQAQARAAAARETVAALEFRRTVGEALSDFRAAEARAGTLERDALPRAEEALRLSDIGYRAGKFALLEVLSAADARDDLRRALIDAREAQGKAAALLIRLAAQ